MTHRYMANDSSSVHTVRAVHAALICLAVIVLSISSLCLRRRLPRPAPLLSHFALAGAGCIFVSALYQMTHGKSVRGDTTVVVVQLGAVLWLLLLMYSARHTNIAATPLFFSLLLALVATEWTCMATQFFSASSLHFFDVVTDAILLLPHTFALLSIVGWDWLMVNDIAVIFDSNLPERRRHENKNNENDDHNTQSSEFVLLPLSDDIISAEYLCGADSYCMRNNTPTKESINTISIIIRTLVYRWGPTYLLLAVVRLLYDVGGLLPGFLLRGLVDNLMEANKAEKTKKNGVDGYMQTSVMTIVLIILCTLACTFLRVHYNIKLQKISLYNRNVLMNELFNRVIHSRRYQLGSKREGDIINHLSVDIQRVADVTQSINDLWALPLQLFFALYLLYIQVSFAFIAGVLVTVVLIPVNMYLAKQIKHVQTNLMRENDERVVTIAEAINNISYIKMCGWSHLVLKWVEAPRLHYMRHLRWLKYLDAWCVFFWAVTPTVVSLLTFITFVWMHGELTPGKAVTALALFGSLILPLNAYPWVMNGVMEAYVSWKRLKPFFDGKVNNSNNYSVFLDDMNNNNNNNNNNTMRRDDKEEKIVLFLSGENQPLLPASHVMSEPYQMKQRQNNSREKCSDHHLADTLLPSSPSPSPLVVVDIDHGELLLTTPSKNGNIILDETFSLRILKFHASRGQLVVIVGPSASGKTAFLNTLAGEFIMLSTSSSSSSSCFLPRASSMALIEQDPFLMPGTIRDNILFGLPFDPARYEASVRAVALDEDLSQNFAPEGDATLVGDRGRKLSGGQKVRVALARAMYAEKELLLVDDILGSLDVKVAGHIVTDFFLAAKRSNKCVIAVSHHEGLIECAEAVYECADGKLCINESLGRTNNTKRRSRTSSSALWKSVEKVEEKEEEEECEINERKNQIIENTKGFHSTSEIKEHGVIAWSTVMCYLSHVGWKLTLFIIFSVVAMQFARNASDQYIVMWSKQNNGDTYQFISILTLFTVLNSVLALIRGFSFAFGGLRAAERLHGELLHRIIFGTFLFFSNTSLGQIINRLSNDVYTIDDSLPFIINILLAQTFLLVGSVLIIIVNSTGVILFVMIPVVLLYYYVQYPYRILSREIRRLEAAARAPLIDSMRDVLEGGVVIRSFGSAPILFYMRQIQEQIGVLLQRQYNAILLNAWFSLRLELVSVLLLIAVGALTIYSHGSPHAPMQGLALAYVQPLTSYVNGALGAFTGTEKDFVSVERVRQYFSLPQEEEDGEGKENKCPHVSSPFTTTTTGWPSRGTIDFVNVSMQYDVSGPEVLHNLTFHVEAGEKVAIVGRTGAGKSSIFVALLRLVDVKGGYIAIDECNIHELPINVLRTRLSVIPQQPFIFHGTLRKNVDPFGLHTDDEIDVVLGHVGLHNVRLDSDIVVGDNVSGGKQHQIAIARVLLQHSSLLLLDEPVSQVNSEVEAMLWRVLDTHLAGTTLLCITHKLSHIDFFDRVIVIDKGRVVNSGPPAVLRRDGVWPFTPNTDLIIAPSPS